MGFREIKVEELNFNPFTRIGKDWMLISAGTEEKWNTMTASWGGVGVFWGKNAVTVYIRPQRYTKEFVDGNDTFSIAFFKDGHREALSLCGTVSGRDVDKVRESGLTPYFVEGTPACEEADLVITCKKMYHTEMSQGVFDQPENDRKWYPDRDYHVMYIAEILKVLVKERDV